MLLRIPFILTVSCLFWVFLTFFAPQKAAAAQNISHCLCTPDNFINRWHQANAVFTGTVTGIKEMKDYTRKGDEIAVEVTLHVDEAFKNAEAGKDFILYDSLPVYTCRGYPYKKGQRYLIYAYMRETQTFEYWSAYNFPSGTYGSGGVCGGIKTMDDPKTAQEIADIKADLKKNPPKKGILGKIINAGKILKKEKEMEQR